MGAVPNADQEPLHVRFGDASRRGHNGLVTAFYLAKAGFKPLVLERSAQVGGAAVTDEFHPGFRCSTLAHTAGPIRPDIVRDMQLEKYDLRLITPDVCVTALSPDG